jgi:hypothetical protein
MMLIVLFVTATSEAGTLQGKLGELLGLDKPESGLESLDAPKTSAKAESITDPSMVSICLWLAGTTEFDSPDNDFLGRVGVQLADVELGWESTWMGVHGDQVHGVYALMHLVGEAGILGQPYVGYHATIIDAEDGGFYGPILGTRYVLTKNMDTVVEGWYRDFTGHFQDVAEQNDVWKLFAGIRYRF